MRINWKNFTLVCSSFMWCNLLTDYLLEDFSHIPNSIIYSLIFTGIIAIISSWFVYQDKVLAWFVLGYTILAFYERITFDANVSFANMPLFLSLNFVPEDPDTWIKIINPIALLFFFPLLFTVGLDILPYNKINAKSVIILLILILAAILYNWSPLNSYKII